MTDFNNIHIKSILQDADPLKITTIEELEIIDAETEARLNEPAKIYADTIYTANKVLDRIDASKSENAKKNIKAFEDIVTSLNKNYDLDIHIDFSNFTEILRSLVDPKNKELISLYTSEIFARFRLSFYLKLMSAISILADEICSTDNLLNKNHTLADKYAMITKLTELMNSVENINGNIRINSADLELKKISQNRDSGKTDVKNPKVKAFLEQFRDEVIK